MVIPPILLQSRVMRSRSYAVLSGRTRSPRRREFRPLARIAATAGVAFVFAVTLGVPVFGAIIGSFVQNLGIF